MSYKYSADGAVTATDAAGVSFPFHFLSIIPIILPFHFILHIISLFFSVTTLAIHQCLTTATYCFCLTVVFPGEPGSAGSPSGRPFPRALEENL